MKYNLLENYRLEKRLAKVESILLEQTADEINKDLFSRNLDEVKSAVEAGEDVNQADNKGITPLLFAVNSKDENNSDIIEYLLAHGASINDRLNGLNAFELACENNNIEAMKVILANDAHNVINNPSSVIDKNYGDIPNDADVILLAASKERSKFNENLHSFYCAAYGRSIISKSSMCRL